MAWGDRKDGRLMRELDSLHYITGIIYPNRCDNEAFLPLKIDYTKTDEFIRRKNAARPDIKYNHFQIIATAVLKTLTLKPKMNRFIVNSNFYQRNEVSTSFVVKKSFEEDGAEALAFVHAVPEDTLETIRQKMKEQIALFDPRPLAGVVKTVYLRKRARLASGKKSMSSDERVLQSAGKKLFEEMAFAMQEDIVKVRDNFFRRLDVLEA